MITIRCPKCKATAQVGPELAGQPYRCLQCQTLLRVPGQAAPAPPPKPEVIDLPPDAVVESVPPAPVPAPTAAPTPARKDSGPRTFDELWQNSQAVDEERTNLENLQVKLADRAMMPMPAVAPKLADKLGKPIASLRGVPKMPVWRIALCGFITAAGFAVIGLAVLTAVFGPQGNPGGGRRGAGAPAPLCFGALGVLMIPLSLLALRRGTTNSLRANFWLCENGVVWERGGYADAVAFERIREVYRDRTFVQRTDRAGNIWVTAVPVIRVMLRDENVTFRQTTDQETAEFIAYLEHKVTAVFFKNSLRRIHDGESVSFGAFDMDRHGVRFSNDVYAWSTIKAVEIQPAPYALVLVRRRKKPVVFNAHNISLARVAASIGAVILAEKLEVEENEVEVKQEVKNPFAF